MNYTELKTVIKFCHISKQYIGDPIWWKRTVIPISLTFGILKYFVHSFNFQTKLKIQLFKKSRLGSISDVYPTFPRALLDKVSLFHILLIRLFNTVWASLVAQVVKNLHIMQETQVWSLAQEEPLEKGMPTHFSVLAWRIPWTEEPGSVLGALCLPDCQVSHQWNSYSVYTQEVYSSVQEAEM